MTDFLRRRRHIWVVNVDGRPTNEAEAQAWAEKLARDTREVLEKFPEADADNVRHALILMQLPPEERLARALLRGGARRGQRKIPTVKV
jgi:hypothetical protein